MTRREMTVDVQDLERRIESSDDIRDLKDALLIAVGALESADDEDALNDIDWEVS